MGGLFGGGSRPAPAPVQPAKPYVAPAPAIRSEEQETGKKRKKKKMVSGEAATVLTGTQGLTTSGTSKSTKTLLGD
ncbi:MAG: hypothetical protein CMC15_14620 [Flavobacteriaceae bacterium]|mgnify:FL=1|jgi:hypothetical protein|nr:hypothetical protein [Flavobacteriaceae bacterium]|tara:strand:+ start:133 stop:360 length:228 start_codon:yes stop_codon:yes gene_type:complete